MPRRTPILMRAGETTTRRGAARRLLPPLAAAGAMALLLATPFAAELLLRTTRPVVLALVQLLVPDASGDSAVLRIGAVFVPWTRDCAGLDLMAVLLATAIWAHRDRRGFWSWLVLLTVVAAAGLAANVARILAVVAYRAAFFPSVESAELHYLLGFLALLPVLPLVLPRRALGLDGASQLRAAAVFALVSTRWGAPGGWVVAACAFAFLAQVHLSGPEAVRRRGANVVFWLLWLLGATAVATMRMESLWLPWLLVCPAWLRFAELFRPSRIVVLGGTLPVVALHPVSAVCALAGVVAMGVERLRETGVGCETGVGEKCARSFGSRVAAGLLGAALLMPFVAPLLPSGPELGVSPPAGALEIQPGCYSVRIAGQEPGSQIWWFAPQGGGRHHTLEVCMRFRGISLTPTPAAAVWTDGTRYYREYFLVGSRLLDSYAAYLRRTLLPGSEVGVHMIVTAPARAGGEARFVEQAAASIRQLVPEAARATPDGGRATGGLRPD